MRLAEKLKTKTLLTLMRGVAGAERHAGRAAMRAVVRL